MVEVSARFAYCPSQGWLKNVLFQIQHGRIQNLQAGISESCKWDLILPGFVNLHAHLELSHLQNQLKPAQAFSHWVGELRSLTQNWTTEDFKNSFHFGQKSCQLTGTTSVLDIGNSGANLLDTPLIRLWSKLELMGYKSADADTKWNTAQQLLTHELTHPWRQSSLCPHAPFSTSPQLLNYLKSHQPWCIHVDESMDEEALFQRHEGNLVDLLAFLAPNEPLPPLSHSALDYLLDLDLVPPHPILVHGNHLSRPTLERIKALNPTLVYCPESQDFFKHKSPELKLWQELGLNIGLGTDSLASAYSLNLWESVVRVLNTGLFSLDEVLNMATYSGALALGQQDLGHLSSGAIADLQAYQLPLLHEPDFDSSWVHSSLTPQQVWLNGQTLFG